MKQSTSFVRRFAVPMTIALVALGVGSAAYASQKVKPKKITCEDFLALGTEAQPRVVYWLEGFSKSGKLEDEEIDVDPMESPVAVVVTECHKAPKATLWEKLEGVL